MVAAPGKAANAGGVAVSGLEMRQNAGFARWSAAWMEDEPHEILGAVHDAMADEGHAGRTGAPDDRRGANLVACRRLALAIPVGGAL